MKAFILTLFLLLAALIRGVFSADATFEWDDTNNVPRAAKYKLYLGHSPRSYLVIEQTTNTVHTVTGLSRGRTYYAAVTALDTNGLESPFSEEISFVLLNAPGKPKPTNKKP